MAGVFELLVSRLFSVHYLNRDKLDDDAQLAVDDEEQTQVTDLPIPGTSLRVNNPDIRRDFSQNTTFSRLMIRSGRRSANYRPHAEGSVGDITNWGSYLEHAPPVLPQNITAPGYEPLSRRRGRKKRKSFDTAEEHVADDTDIDDDDSGEEVEDDELDPFGVGNAEGAEDPALTSSPSDRHAVLGESRGPRTLQRSENRFSFPSLQSLFPLASLFPFSATSTSSSTTAPSTPSSLFGSTTRPASERTLEGNGYEQPISILRRASDFYLRWENWVPTPSATHRTSSAFSTQTSAASLENSNGAVSRSLAHTRIARMAPKTHAWVSLWFLLTAPVIFWDAMYCFMR
jgi:hypothetical protein